MSQKWDSPMPLVMVGSLTVIFLVMLAVGDRRQLITA